MVLAVEQRELADVYMHQALNTMSYHKLFTMYPSSSTQVGSAYCYMTSALVSAVIMTTRLSAILLADRCALDHSPVRPQSYQPVVHAVDGQLLNNSLASEVHGAYALCKGCGHLAEFRPSMHNWCSYGCAKRLLWSSGYSQAGYSRLPVVKFGVRCCPCSCPALNRASVLGPLPKPLL